MQLNNKSNNFPLKTTLLLNCQANFKNYCLKLNVFTQQGFEYILHIVGMNILQTEEMCQFLIQWHSLQLAIIFLVLLHFITPIYLKYTDRPSTDPPLLMNSIIHLKKLNIQKTKIMASSPITSWQIDWENSGNSDRFYFLGLQNHCRWWL